MDAPANGVADAKIRVLVVDDHPTLSEPMVLALGRAADLEVLGAVESGEAAVERVRALEGAIDVVLMDVEMPGIGGLAATAQIHAAYPDSRVILLTNAPHYAAAGRRAGATGYVLKGSRVQDVLAAIRAVHRGVLHYEVAPDVGILLSDAEVQILELIADSMSNTEIGQHLGWSTSAVSAHVRSLLRKLGATGREQAVRLGMRLGLIR